MSVDCGVYLPEDIPSQHVADAIAILLGETPEVIKRPDGTVVIQTSAQVVKRPTDSYTTFKFSPEVYERLDNIGGIGHQGFDPIFSFNTEHPEGSGKMYNELFMRSTAAKIALAKALGQFYGGIVVPRDSSDIEWRFKRKIPKFDQKVENKEWNAYQRAYLKLKPLTFEDAYEVRKFASYGEYEREHGLTVTPRTQKQKQLAITYADYRRPGKHIQKYHRKG